MLILGWTAVDLVLVEDSLFLMVADNGFFSFFGSKISAVTVYRLFFAGQKLRNHGHIVYVGTGASNRMDQVSVFVHTDISRIAKMPCIALFDRMRLRIPLLFLTFGRGGCRNQRGIHNGSLFQQQSPFQQQLHYLGKQFLLRTMLEQQIPESPQCIAVRHLVTGFRPAKFRRRTAVHRLCHRSIIR